LETAIFFTVKCFRLLGIDSTIGTRYTLIEEDHYHCDSVILLKSGQPTCHPFFLQLLSEDPFAKYFQPYLSHHTR